MKTDAELEALRVKERELHVTVAAAKSAHERAIDAWHDVYAQIRDEENKRRLLVELKEEGKIP